MSIRPKLQKIGNREWSHVRDSWLAHVPRFAFPGSPPDPGLEKLQPLLQVPITDLAARTADVPGLRTTLLWEAVFLFHKCSHTHLASLRLGHVGMHSWALFNAYHSAYLGARSIMSLLGVALPDLAGKQVLIDVFPEPIRRPKRLAAPVFEEFLALKMPKIEQRYLWEAFQRVIRMTEATCWDRELLGELLDLSFEEITRPRNHFIYKPPFWPAEDLLADLPGAELSAYVSGTLDTGEKGFLLRLGCVVYRLADQLFTDLAAVSGVVASELAASRFRQAGSAPEVSCYASFVDANS